MISFFTEYAAMKRLLSRQYDFIFYVENAYYFQYLEHLFESLLSAGASVAYVSSAANDPLLRRQAPGLDTCYLKIMAAAAFPRMRAKAVVMTMPDLQQFIFKRSPSVSKYIYVFHALVSTHQQYRRGAFDHYDTILCAGPHHEREIRETEALYGLPAKELLPYGYPLLSRLEEKAKSTTPSSSVLIAPSWYTGGIFDTCIGKLVEVLQALPYRVIIRAHPEFIKRRKKQYRQLQKAMVPGKLEFDTEPSLANSMLQAGWLITDRSGIAYEFAFARNTPVVFIDTPPKVQNPEWQRLSARPVENGYREKAGIIVLPGALDALPRLLQEWGERAAPYKKTIAAAREAMVFENVSDRAARYIGEPAV